MDTRPIFLGASAIIGIGLCVALWPEPYSREQCLLDKMKYQPAVLYQAAVTLCDRFDSKAPEAMKEATKSGRVFSLDDLK